MLGTRCEITVHIVEHSSHCVSRTALSVEFNVHTHYTQGVTEHSTELPSPRPTPGRADGIRARNRAGIETELRAAARRQLAEVGAAALSLRAVARDMGMVPSALFRYVSGRDELLTLLIVEAYSGLADAVQGQHDAVDPADLRGRWAALAGATRTWALANPHEWALIYGSPVPRYDAPSEQTTDPGTRVARLLLAIGQDAVTRGHAGGTPFGPAPQARELAERATQGLRQEPEFTTAGMPAVALANGLVAWNMLVGAVSAEVFRQLGEQTIADPRAFFDYHVGTAGAILFGPAG